MEIPLRCARGMGVRVMNMEIPLRCRSRNGGRVMKKIEKNIH